MTPSDLLGAARELIARPDAATAGVWPRTAAFLARQAIEQSIASIWKAQADTADLGSCTMRSQLTCLASYIDAETAAQVAYTWAALSGACHYHRYELAPTATELTSWINDADQLIVRLP
jgi:hypothetical protein